MQTRIGTRARRAAALLAIGGLAVGAVAAKPNDVAARPAAKDAADAAPAASNRRVAVYIDSADALAVATAAANGKKVADYGAFSLWRVDPAAADGAGMVAAGDLDHLELRGRVIDTATGKEPTVAADLRQADAGAHALHLVQFAGPIKPAWVQSLARLRLSIVSVVPPNGFVVYGTNSAVAALEARAAKSASIQYTGAFRPAYRISPRLLTDTAADAAAIDVTVQLVAGADADIAAAAALGEPLTSPMTIVGLTSFAMRVRGDTIAELAKLPATVNVEPYATPEPMDEAQGQIVAGNLSTVAGKKVPSGVGYLGYLTNQNVPTDPAQHPKVAVIDDGVDDGTDAPNHPDFYRNGSPMQASRVNGNFDCTVSGTPAGLDGHGTLNAGIIGGFNNGAGFPREDANGFQYGLGIDPYARLSNIKIFGPGFNLTNCGGNDAGIVARAFSQGADITSNSWGANVGGAYTAASQAWDALTRDASAGTAGNQEMFHVFSAGNAGPGANTVGAPGTAKNVLTVAATENVRDQGVVDGCGEPNADNADDMANFSSRGPTDDLRAKPDIAAPGTHVQGPASQIGGYNGTGVCGPTGGGTAYPPGQTLYNWSSGTSHSAPAVTGAAALVWEYYKRVLKPGVKPSPAMLKAILVSSGRHLTGVAANDTLPGIAQGWGDVHLKSMLGVARYTEDQVTTFTATGQEKRTVFNVTDSTKPIRIALAYSDAPGSTVGNSFVNDLDLLVVAGGKIYFGNVFSGATSVTGGTTDSRNNVEQVWLPAGVTGKVAVQVIARNIAGNGVPGGAALDQDYALTAANLTKVAAPTPVPVVQAMTRSDNLTGANNSGGIDPGEPFYAAASIINLGTGPTVAGKVKATVTGGALTPIDTTQAVPVVNGNAIQTTATNGLMFRLDQSAGCGVAASVKIDYTAGSANATATFPFATGGPSAGATTTVNSADVPKAVPDNNLTGVSSTLNVAGIPAVIAVRPKVNVTHTFDGDLVLKLTAPNGQVSTLSNRRGGSGDNFVNTVFDDSAATAIASGAAPFTGSFRPDTALAPLTNGSPNGTWTLTVVDAASLDTGTLNSWSLDLVRPGCVAVPKGVAVRDASIAEGTGAGTTTMNIIVVRTGPITGAANFVVSTANGTATAPADYTARTGVAVNFTAGQANKTVAVTIVRDAVVEPAETLKLVVGNPLPAGYVKARGTGFGTINNDD